MNWMEVALHFVYLGDGEVKKWCALSNSFDLLLNRGTFDFLCSPITEEHLYASFGASRCWLTTPGQPRRRKKLPGRYCSPTQVLAITGEFSLNHIQVFSNCFRGDK